jgi:acyl carrier protein
MSVEPVDRDEEMLSIVLSVAREVLRRDVGPEDNFFEEGGDSLAAMQMVGKLRQETSIPVQLRMLFEGPDFSTVSQEMQAAAESF